MTNEIKKCQNCKKHTNNPSYCTLKKEHVGRKNQCDDFVKK